MKKLLLTLFFALFCAQVKASIEPGAYQTGLYLPLLKNKRVAVFANQTSMIKQTHLIDMLLKNHIHVVKIFTPEHGFRGEEDDKIKDSIDSKTGLPIISLYGKKLSPTTEDLKNIDILLFDIQDVGVRFYTYISSLEKLMEAALKNNKPLIILDRPNPNGFYIDGPVLDLQHRSFTGMQSIPIVYGMTIGEYATMLVGENWLHTLPKIDAKKLNLKIIRCVHYTHDSLYELPTKPSPNLPTMQSIYLYPSIGLMEATALSVGRGTAHPFQIFGHPDLSTEFCFTPTSRPEAKFPRYQDKICYGWQLISDKEIILKKINKQLQIKYLINAYKLFPNKEHFFMGFSSTAGNDLLEQQIKSGMSEEEIRKSWQPKLDQFKKIRKKYLLYPDISS